MGGRDISLVARGLFLNANPFGDTYNQKNSIGFFLKRGLLSGQVVGRETVLAA